jgi:hypothetical protein
MPIAEEEREAKLQDETIPASVEERPRGLTLDYAGNSYA